MGAPVFVARLRLTNGLGTFDSFNPAPKGEQPRIKFQVDKSLASEPNKATIEIFNLAPSTVAKAQATVKRRIEWTPEERAELLAAGASAEPFEVTTDNFGMGAIELSWGYADSATMDIEAALSIGFVGQSKSIREIRSGNDLVLTIQAEDGANTLGAAEVVQMAGAGSVQYRNKSYKKGTDVVDIIVDLINAMGLSVNKADLKTAIETEFIARGLPLAETKTIGGYNASGPARPQLEQFLNALQLKWSIQDGAFLLLTSSSTIPGLAPLPFSSDLGNIIGEVELGENGTATLTTQATTEARPGRQADVLVVTEDIPPVTKIAAAYRIARSSTSGDTYSGGSTALELEELQVIAGVF